MKLSPLYTDHYQLTMGQAYFKENKHETPSCFDYFFRKLPFKGGYVILAGLDSLFEVLEDFRFCERDLEYLHVQGFDSQYLDYLTGFRFRGSVFGMREGEIVFPNEPILRVEGTMLECQLVETVLLNLVNFQSLIATKASRVRQSAGHRLLSDFGLRRAQGAGAMLATRASIIGGFDLTSNVLAALEYGITSSGTMAHSFIESFENELDAFRAYAKTFPDKCVLLVDTYNTLSCGIPNAITVARELEDQGNKLVAIRLDSGDLAYLSKKARQMLNHNGLDYVKIVVSNQLDEHVIKSLLDQGAPIDIFGVGTSMIIGKPDGALDGVYKLSESAGIPKLKLSENVQKTTLPGRKKVLRFVDDDGNFHADCIVLEGQTMPEVMYHPTDKDKSLSLKGLNPQEVFVQHIQNGMLLIPPKPLYELQGEVSKRLKNLPIEHQRFDFPHIYKVGISGELLDLKTNLIRNLTARQ